MTEAKVGENISHNIFRIQRNALFEEVALVDPRACVSMELKRNPDLTSMFEPAIVRTYALKAQGFVESTHQHPICRNSTGCKSSDSLNDDHGEVMSNPKGCYHKPSRPFVSLPGPPNQHPMIKSAPPAFK